MMFTHALQISRGFAGQKVRMCMRFKLVLKHSLNAKKLYRGTPKSKAEPNRLHLTIYVLGQLYFSASSAPLGRCIYCFPGLIWSLKIY